MAWAGLAQPRAQALQVVPAALLSDGTAQALTHPRCHHAACPALPSGSRAAERLAQLFQLRAGEQQWRAPRPRVLPVDHALRPLGVVALGDLADPVARVAGALRHQLRGLAAREQPEDLPPTALGGLMRPPIAGRQFVCGQVGNKLYSSHVPIVQQ